MSADGGSRNEAQSHCLHRNTLYSENTQTQTHKHTNCTFYSSLGM